MQGLHSRGVQEGVQTCGFVRGSRCARNPVVAPVQFRPATFLGQTPRFPGCLSHFDAIFVPLRAVLGGLLTVC